MGQCNPIQWIQLGCWKARPRAAQGKPRTDTKARVKRYRNRCARLCAQAGDELHVSSSSCRFHCHINLCHSVCFIAEAVVTESAQRNRRMTAGHAPTRWEPTIAEPSERSRSRSHHRPAEPVLLHQVSPSICRSSCMLASCLYCASDLHWHSDDKCAWLFRNHSLTGTRPHLLCQ